MKRKKSERGSRIHLNETLNDSDLKTWTCSGDLSWCWTCWTVRTSSLEPARPWRDSVSPNGETRLHYNGQDKSDLDRT